ncbi:MAG: tRNA 2-thiocytidine(32) synthetase TtcA, partial [Lachnospiraceae bacterium]
DDVVDTMMLSLVYESRWHTLSPVTHLDKTGLTLIRPLIYVKEADIKGFIKDYQLPVHRNPCPADHHTRRETVKKMIHLIDQEAPGVRERIFTAICQSGIDGWLPR